MDNYDFGDGREHEVTMKKIIDSGSLIADCIGGKGTCPPEDFFFHFSKEIKKTG